MLSKIFLYLDIPANQIRPPMKVFLKYSLFILFLVAFTSKAFAQNDFRVALSFDPKMKIYGPYDYSTSGEWNLLLRGAFKHKNFEYALFLEGFDAISYGAIGINVNYVFGIQDKQNRFDRWEFAVGPGYGVVLREELDVYEDIIEFNGDTRYFFNKNLGLQLLGNLKYRSDLVEEYDEEDPWRLSAFFGLIYRW